MNTTKAAKILDAIRNDRTTTTDELSRQVGELLRECQELHWSLNDEPTHHGTRLVIR